MSLVLIRFPPPAPLMSLNQRQHWAARHRQTTLWRNTATQAAWMLRQPRRQPPSSVEIFLPVATNRNRDPHNYVPTLKAVIDGFVKAGLWPDDTPEYVHTLEPRLVIGARLVEVRLTPHPNQPTEETAP